VSGSAHRAPRPHLKRQERALGLLESRLIAPESRAEAPELESPDAPESATLPSEAVCPQLVTGKTARVYSRTKGPGRAVCFILVTVSWVSGQAPEPGV
jgi:hypothetical protein